MSTTTYKAGQTVQIEPRTFPGSNKQGGTALITHIHHDANNIPSTIDVKYVLGGSESGIELTYVSLPQEQQPRRCTRERKQDVKMNISNKESKAKKKRGALKDIDGNSKKQKVEKGNFDELPSGCVVEGEWMVIKSGKLSDYTPYFTKGTSIQFWWDDEKGWLHATCLNDITRNLSRGIIRWMVKMKFEEDNETFSYAFHPKDSRWKIKIEKKEAANEAKSKAPKKQEAAVKKSKAPSTKKKEKVPFTITADSDSEDDAVLSQLKPSPKSKSPPSSEKDASKNVKALPSITPVAKKDVTTKTLQKPVDLGLIDKGAKAKSRDVAAEMPKSTDLAKNSTNSTTAGGDAIFVTKPKPASISFQYNAVSSYSAAAAASSAATSKFMGQKKNDTIPASKFHKSTAKMSDPFQRTQLPNAASKLSPFSAGVGDKLKVAASNAVKRSRDAASGTTKPAMSKTIGGLTVMDGMYRPTHMLKPSVAKPKDKTMTEKIYNKAREEAKSFMAGMMDKKPDEEEAEKPFSTSSDEEEELDVKIGQDRKTLFQEGLAEVFFKSYQDEMDVDVFMKRLNDHIAFRGHETFTLPEVATYLEQFDKEGKIMVSWKEGRYGKIYQV